MDKIKYTREEIVESMRVLQEVFDIVRLVDPFHTFTCRINDDGELEREPFHCHAVWERGARCSNCVSLQVMAERRRLSKYEFMGDEIYYVVSKYIEIDGKPVAMELVSNVTKELVLDANGKNTLVSAITHHNTKLYRDALTGAYNRTYYEEQLMVVSGNTGVAMIDADNFKGVNDTYGHDAGDEVLRAIAETIMKNIRSADFLVRYGGDEFLLMLTGISEDALCQRLSELPAQIAALRFEKYPGLRATVSVGAAWFRDKSWTEECMKKADGALYEAKKTKNCFRFT